MSNVDVAVPTQIASVAREACSRWRAVGEETEVIKWADLVGELGLTACGARNIPEAILVRRTNSVECLVEDHADWREVCVGVSALVERGWDVTVLAPIEALGVAHVGLRGTAARIQGWWSREKLVRFSPVELA
ncbi:hypothetical protein ACF1AJ_13530 [Leifsonia sp. NPDC014704]|uniref:hypothetical protein n=1 Tax=Leifsonia sp. NPDC014704 TaxID=3364123 RepID=UPI0036F45ABC